MPATVSILENNGPSPGTVTQNVSTINWGNLDKPNISLANFTAAISLGANSFTKYNYIMFSGAFTSLGNVSITHLAGTVPSGIKLVSSSTMITDSNKVTYSQPTTTSQPSITPNDFSNIGSTINLFVSPGLAPYDPASAPNKMPISYNSSGSLYTNYLVTQIQASYGGTTGKLGPIVLSINYDEA